MADTVPDTPDTVKTAGRPSARARIRAVVIDAAVGLALTAALVYGKHVLEGGRFGRQIEQMGLTLQQLRLADIVAPDSDVSVRVVDISDLDLTGRNGVGDPVLVTNRDQLRTLIELIEHRAHPKAIGIDVLLDPPDDQLTPNERVLLDYCLSLKDWQGNQRAFVAVFDNTVLGPERWLGDPKYAPLAALALVPRPVDAVATDQLVKRLAFAEDDYRDLKLESLAFKVAEAKRAQDAREAGSAWLESFPSLVTRWRAIQKQPFVGDQSFINYGALPRLMRDAVPASKVDTAKIDEAIVILGRTRNTTDTFVVPGRPEPVAGVYVQASAAYTLAKAPLYTLTAKGRVLYDVIAALVPIGFVLAWRILAIRRGWRYGGGHRLPVALTVMTAVAVFVIGHFWFVVTGILSADYLLVAAALLLHSAIEPPLTHLFGRRRHRSNEANGVQS